MLGKVYKFFVVVTTSQQPREAKDMTQVLFFTYETPDKCWQITNSVTLVFFYFSFSFFLVFIISFWHFSLFVALVSSFSFCLWYTNFCFWFSYMFKKTHKFLCTFQNSIWFLIKFKFVVKKEQISHWILSRISPVK